MFTCFSHDDGKFGIKGEKNWVISKTVSIIVMRKVIFNNSKGEVISLDKNNGNLN